MNRIICIGNRYAASDTAGPLVYGRLVGGEIPCGVEVIDGGLAGLDLLRFMEDCERVVFVDAVLDRNRADGVFVLDIDEAALWGGHSYDHSAGLPYLLRVYSRVCECPPREVLLVGVKGEPDPVKVEAAARLCLELAAVDQVKDSVVYSSSGGVR